MDLHYRTAGEGPAVLLIHGGGEDAGMLDPLGHALAARGFRAIWYDRRGTGRSTCDNWPGGGAAQHADDAANLLKTLDVTGAAVVGFSSGGVVALALAARLPAPGSAAQPAAPGSVAQPAAPGSAARLPAPGSVAQAAAPGSVAQPAEPGSAARLPAPTLAAQLLAPASATLEPGVVERVIAWEPAALGMLPDGAEIQAQMNAPAAYLAEHPGDWVGAFHVTLDVLSEGRADHESPEVEAMTANAEAMIRDDAQFVLGRGFAAGELLAGRVRIAVSEAPDPLHGAIAEAVAALAGGVPEVVRGADDHEVYLKQPDVMAGFLARSLLA